MPKVVDHDARRRRIIEAYLELVAEEGFAAANGKAVAARLGMSSGSLWHYFSTFDEVIEAAALSVFERDSSRVRAEKRRGLEGLCQAIEAQLPLHPKTHSEAEVIVSFWAQIPSRPALRTPFASPEVFSQPLERLIAEGVTDGELRPDAPVALLAETLNQLLDGAQVAQVLEPQSLPQRRLARAACLVSPWLTGQARSHGAQQLRSWLADDERSVGE